MEFSTVNPDVRARIIESIERLYDDLGRGDQYPRAQDVRSAARCDMNAATQVLREWKLQQTARPVPVAVAVPEPVQQALLQATAILWSSAQDQANASLRDAESKWELERQGNEALRRDMADAYEQAEAGRERAEAALVESQAAHMDLQELNAALTAQLAEAREIVAQQRARADENERRADDLKAELLTAHEDNAGVRRELSEARQLHASEMLEHKSVSAQQIERLNESLASSRGRLESAVEQLESRNTELHQLQGQLAQAEAREGSALADVKRLQGDLQHLRDESATARREATESAQALAKSSGVLEAVQAQNAELMALLGPKAPRKPAKQ